MEQMEFCVDEMFDIDSPESDEEADIEDVRQLTAVIAADKSTAGSSEPRTVSNTTIEKIDRALSINKLATAKFTQLETVLIGRLKECRQKLQETRDSLTGNQGKKQDKQVFRYLTCGKPYFKDRDHFPAPDNDDTITMQRVGMYDFSEVTSVPGWTVKDKHQFLEQITIMSRNIKKKELNSEIAQLRRESKVKDSKQINKQVLALKNQLSKLDKMPLSLSLALPIDQEYDWDAIAVALNQRHSAQEYRALWKVFLHPSINKKSWDRHEHYKLQQLAQLNNLQDWDKIAKELGTGRTAYQCFVYYRTNMGNSLTGRKWSKEEEEFLRRLIDYFKEEDYIPWGKVAAFMESRTKVQVYNKYNRLTEGRKGRFLPEEDAVLLTGVEHLGNNFKKIAKLLPGRSQAQLRTRYHVLSNTTRTSTVWNVEEDRKLIQMMSNQDSSFINYASLTEFFPDKTRAQLRARYSTLIKWMKKNPNKDISKAPRRGARRLSHGQCLGDLQKAVENLKNRIESEVKYKSSHKITKNSPHEVLDHAIIATLITEKAKEEETRRWQSMEVDHNAQKMSATTVINDTNLRKLLIFLKAKLDKEKFLASSYAKDYPNLLQPEPPPCVLNLKSYSKKHETQFFPLCDVIPDIWGDNILKNSEYVLPPNYATITGCKKLMSYIGSKPTPDNRTISMHYTPKRNKLSKEQLDAYMERFNTLFMWPILLSNEDPRSLNEQYTPQPLPISTEAQAKCKRLREMFRVTDTQGIIIPHPDSVEQEIADEQIDLDVSMQNVDSTLSTCVGNEGFLYLEGSK
ncbi:snRNA-activating protein complex subunit 4-like isoform X1 [Pectinophora gossypiella]|nr:snRNA-activating protein complex subunit 4-like isoform X1 [Pectinophora gossypiella]